MRKVLKYLYKQLLPKRLREVLDVFPNLRIPDLPDTVLSEKRVLVLAPHPDDEIIGCGGTIQRYHQQHANVTTVFVTDGRKGNSRYSEENNVAMRQEEATKAAQFVGIDRLIFLDNRDTELSVSPKTSTKLAEVISSVNPEAVFLPFFMDNHVDHMATNQMFLSIADSFPELRCYAYCVWTPLSYFNLTVDIAPYVEKKRHALMQYSSQLQEHDYIESSLGLAKYYAKGDGYAEVFLVCSSQEYKRMALAVGWQYP